MSRVTFVGRVNARAVTGLPPGIVRSVLTSPATDQFGAVWPEGTEYQQISAGRDNLRNADVLDADIVSSPADPYAEAQS